jgi:tetratricopeptide (TPR) repeat protein
MQSAGGSAAGPWVSALILLAAAGGALPASAAKKGRGTIAHRILDLEAKVMDVRPEMYALIDRVIRAARARLRIEPKMDKERVRAAFAEIDRILIESNVVYPAWQYVATLADALTDTDLDDESFARLIAHPWNRRRVQWLEAHRAGPFRIADCDTTSYLYLAIGEALGLPLRFVERPSTGGEIGHNWVAWMLPDGSRFDWDTMTGYEREASGIVYQGEKQVMGYEHFIIASIWNERGFYRKAAVHYGLGAKLAGTAAAWNALAWLLATCPDRRVRDGKRAVEAASAAVARDKDPNYLDTLAAAQAEAGRFDEAVISQERAVQGARSRGDPIGSFASRLYAYQRRSRYLEPRREERSAQGACEAMRESRDSARRCRDREAAPGAAGSR